MYFFFQETFECIFYIFLVATKPFHGLRCTVRVGPSIGPCWIVGKALSARWAEDDYGNGPRLIALPIAVGGYWLLYGSYVHPEYSLFPLFI